MTDTPLFDATLADLLERARHDGELARARWALAERAAGERVAAAERAARLQIAQAQRQAEQATRAAAAALRAADRAERLAAEQVAAAERKAEHAQREARLRHALVAEETEERVRAALALSAPALPPLRIDLDADPDLEPADAGDERSERDAPPVPSMEELLRPMPGVTRFLDSLLGSPDR